MPDVLYPNGQVLAVTGWIIDPVTGKPVAVQGVSLIPASGTVSSSGDNDLVTPTAGKAIRLYYVSYNPTAAPVTAFFKLGAKQFLLNLLAVANSIIMKDCGDKYIQGNPDEKLKLNLNSAISTNWNAMYIEV